MIVRHASIGDMTGIIAVEQLVWSSLGTEVYGREYFESWLAVNSDCFLVAEMDGSIVGYTYAQIIDFSLKDIDTLTTYDALTDAGYTRNSHRPSGNSLCGISIVSIQRGAGRMLNDAIYAIGRQLGKEYYVGFSRMSGFAEYCKTITDIQRPKDLDALALWYAYDTAQKKQAYIYDSLGPRPDLSLPPPQTADPVLGWHLSMPGVGLVGIKHDFMKDPQSFNYAACILKRLV